MSQGALNPIAAGVAERVSAALRDANLSQAEATRRAQKICPAVIRTVLHKAARLGLRPRNDEVRAAFAQVLGVDSGYLWYGVPTIRRRGMVELAAADMASYDGSDDYSGPAPDLTPGSAPAPSACALPSDGVDLAGYSLRVHHDDWEPLASRGGTLYMTPSFPPAPGDRVYVHDEKGEGVYRLVSVGKEMVTLVSPGGRPIVRSRAGLVIHRIASITF